MPSLHGAARGRGCGIVYVMSDVPANAPEAKSPEVAIFEERGSYDGWMIHLTASFFESGDVIVVDGVAARCDEVRQDGTYTSITSQDLDDPVVVWHGERLWRAGPFWEV